MLRIKAVLMAALFLFTTQASIALAGEHPSEHPVGEQSQVTTNAIAEAIEQHVKSGSKKNDGYFIVEDFATKGVNRCCHCSFTNSRTSVLSRSKIYPR